MRMQQALLFTLFVASAGQANFEDACNNTVQDYALHRDALDAEQYAQLFTPDGAFVTPDKVHQGHTELEAYITSQPDDVSVMHHITTTRITRLNASSGEGTVYVLVHFANAGEGPQPVTQVGGAIYYDQYAYDGERCLIARRELSIKMLTSNGPQ